MGEWSDWLLLGQSTGCGAGPPAPQGESEDGGSDEKDGDGFRDGRGKTQPGVRIKVEGTDACHSGAVLKPMDTGDHRGV